MSGSHCTDNGVMEGFLGILKREMYYGKEFESREKKIRRQSQNIWITIQTTGHREGLGVLTPMEFHEKQRLAA